ncbi:hypothetical protein ANCCAN_03279 [Ancylostoma caninum]|uniref:Uncharacterized protein n=1 Tax=Ancylostoma caninum TaxID=29170 RepID=A0A368H229_ANCCA|nr:hypothetical protein ANCCAN_03279 [Ancylostoma caninum]
MSIADLSWWKYLNWNVTKCTQYDDLNTVWWTTDFQFRASDIATYFTVDLEIACMMRNDREQNWRNTAHANPRKIYKYVDVYLWICKGNTQKAAFGTTCWLVTGILAGILLLCLLVLGYAVYAYRRETKVLSYKLKEMEKTLRSQNEFFTAKLHSQMEEQIKAGERHAEELRKQNETIQAHQLELQRQQQLSAVPPASITQPQPIIIPYLPQNTGQVQKNK